MSSCDERVAVNDDLGVVGTLTLWESFDANDSGYVPKNGGSESEHHGQPIEGSGVMHDFSSILCIVSEQSNA